RGRAAAARLDRGDEAGMTPLPTRSRNTEPTKELIDALYCDEVLQARAMSPEEKFLAGSRLFDYACRITMAGIRHQSPDADEQRGREILAERLELARGLEGSSDQRRGWPLPPP